MSVLIVAEHDNESLNSATLNSVTAANVIGGDIHILVAGHNCASVAEQAAKVAGVSKVLNADSSAYEHALAENVGLLISDIGSSYSHILATSTTNAKNIMPRAAALLDVQAISDISAVIDSETFKRPIYAGNVIATVKSSDSIKVITVRGTAFDGAPDSGGSAAIESVSSAHDAEKSNFVSEEWLNQIGQSLPQRRLLSQVAEVWVAVKILSYSMVLPINLARRSGHRGQQWTQALCPMICR